MRVRRNKRAGFTLIEVMIVVAIVGVLASIAIPNYTGFICKAKQTEAKALLRGIYIAQMAYFNEFQMYLCDPAVLVQYGGIEYTDTQYNVIHVVCPDPLLSYTAQVESRFQGPSGSTDIWALFTRGTLIHQQDGCTY